MIKSEILEILISFLIYIISMMGLMIYIIRSDFKELRQSLHKLEEKIDRERFKR